MYYNVHSRFLEQYQWTSILSFFATVLLKLAHIPDLMDVCHHRSVLYIITQTLLFCSTFTKLDSHTIYLPKLDGHTVYLPKLDSYTIYLPKLDGNTVYLPKFDYHTMYLPKLDGNTKYLPKLNDHPPYIFNKIR